MALIHRSLFTWFVFLIFFTLIILNFDSRITWNWFLIFIPMWLYDFISIFYLIFCILSQFKNGSAVSRIKLVSWNGVLLCCVTFKILFQILLCLYLQDEPISLKKVMIPAWVLMIAFCLNLISEIRKDLKVRPRIDHETSSGLPTCKRNVDH